MARVMGWHESLATKSYWVDDNENIQFSIAGKLKIGNIWMPEHRIDQAMMIIEKVLRDTPTLTMKMEIGVKKSWVQFIDCGFAIIVDKKVEAETPQMAICLAVANL